MIEGLIGFLITCIVFAIIGLGLYLICKHFFSGFQPAYWISGGILLVLVLYYAFRVASNGSLPKLP